LDDLFNLNFKLLHKFSYTFLFLFDFFSGCKDAVNVVGEGYGAVDVDFLERNSAGCKYITLAGSIDFFEFTVREILQNRVAILQRSDNLSRFVLPFVDNGASFSNVFFED
jgi:hypothetical protein